MASRSWRPADAPSKRAARALVTDCGGVAQTNTVNALTGGDAPFNQTHPSGKACMPFPANQARRMFGRLRHGSKNRRPLGHRFELPIPCGSDYAREIGPACRTRLPRDNTETLQHSWLSIKFRSVIMRLHIYMMVPAASHVALTRISSLSGSSAA